MKHTRNSAVDNLFSGLRVKCSCTFNVAVHTLITETAEALDLSVVDFLPGLGQEQLFYLRGVHMRKQDLGTDKNPYNLAANEQHLKHDPSRLKW